YILAANWFLNDGEVIMTIPNNAPTGYYAPELNQDAKLGDVITLGQFGGISGQFIPNQESRERGIAILNEAAAKFPNRVDIHLGLIDALKNTNDTQRTIGAIES